LSLVHFARGPIFQVPTNAFRQLYWENREENGIVEKGGFEEDNVPELENLSFLNSASLNIFLDSVFPSCVQTVLKGRRLQPGVWQLP
jgi:hypothetical protein